MSTNDFKPMDKDFINHMEKELALHPYLDTSEYINQKTELPLTRMERRKLERKKKKNENTK